MQLRRILSPFLSLLILAASSVQADPLTKPVFDNPKKQLDQMFAKGLKKAKTAVVATVKLKVPAAGKVHGRTSKGDSHAHATAKFAVSGLEKAFLQDVAKAIQDDLVEKLRAAGWEVLTYDDVKGDKEVAALDRLQNGKNAEFPTETPGADVILVATPSDDNNFKPAFQGLPWALRKVAKARDAVVFAPSYAVVSPQFWVEERKGFASNSVKVNNAPGMTLLPRGFALDFINAKSTGGSIFNTDMYVGLAESAGTLSLVDDKSPTAANAISKGLAMLAGGGSVDRGVSIYSFEINPEAYKAAVLDAAKAFNAAAVAMAEGYRSK